MKVRKFPKSPLISKVPPNSPLICRCFSCWSAHDRWMQRSMSIPHVCNPSCACRCCARNCNRMPAIQRSLLQHNLSNFSRMLLHRAARSLRGHSGSQAVDPGSHHTNCEWSSRRALSDSWLSWRESCVGHDHTTSHHSSGDGLRVWGHVYESKEKRLATPPAPVPITLFRHFPTTRLGAERVFLKEYPTQRITNLCLQRNLVELANTFHASAYARIRLDYS